MQIVSCKYVVEQINGDYAMLRNLENPDSELKQVARGLLSEEIMEGTKLLYEFLQYSVIAGEMHAIEYPPSNCRLDFSLFYQIKTKNHFPGTICTLRNGFFLY